MKEWLVGVAAASILSALALALCPPGRVRAVTRLVCGIVCALAVAAPAVKLEAGDLAAAMARYGQAAEKITEDAQEEGKKLERTYIEDRCAAYISDRAAQLGAALTGAAVEARWDEEALIWYPWRARLTGAYDAGLAASIEAELGIPPERQAWIGP